ncbi:hypothetical protein QJ854_gp180 [Moumouvirus goulette]|uniref:BTB domain-containing protein n=1 Tax=Moumouvirus goulette TaxID=1247379 RepID=M1PXV0_9VIRU|nr:hypothetical protein QJ854_gp180 [Moumouvirus goulette]AGF85602.1 hypothetical protein glt_00797 [Moumouvirus goulette]
MNNMDVTIITGNKSFQTKYETIKNVPGFVNNLDSNNTIITQIPKKYVKIILNYLRGYEVTETCDIYHYMYLLNMDIQKENYVKINIGGKIFYLDKNFLISKLEYFEKLFLFHNSLDPDYSSIVIDRCYELFEQVIKYIEKEKQIYFEVEPKINTNLQNELNFYGEKLPKIVKKFINFDHFNFIKNPGDNFYYIKYPITTYKYLSSTNDYNMYSISSVYYNTYNLSISGHKYIKILLELDNKIKKSEVVNYIKILENYNEVTYYYKYDKINNLLLICLEFNNNPDPIFHIQINKIIIIKKFYYLVKYFINDKVTIKNTFYGTIKPAYFKYPIKFGSVTEPINILEINMTDLLVPKFFNPKKSNYSLKYLLDICKTGKDFIFSFDIKCKNIKIYFVEIYNSEEIILRTSVSKIITGSKIKYIVNDFYNKKLKLNLHFDSSSINNSIKIYFKKPSHGKLIINTIFENLVPKFNS